MPELEERFSPRLQLQTKRIPGYGVRWLAIRLNTQQAQVILDRFNRENGMDLKVVDVKEDALALDIEEASQQILIRMAYDFAIYVFPADDMVWAEGDLFVTLDHINETIAQHVRERSGPPTDIGDHTRGTRAVSSRDSDFVQTRVAV
jgi:hypothetical protein